RWPGRFSDMALWCGAIVPDVVDGIGSFVLRGHFQQWLGHTLLGATVIGVPAGLLLTAFVRRVARWSSRMQGGAVRRTLHRVGVWTCAVDNAATVADG